MTLARLHWHLTCHDEAAVIICDHEEPSGGGYVEFTMTTTDSELASGVIVQTGETGDAVPAVISGTAQGQDDLPADFDESG